MAGSADAVVTIGSGFSALWYDPARSGEGLQLEILDAERAWVEWYTYDEQGGQRWLVSLGQIVHDTAGDSIEFSELYVTRNGRFGPDFDPKQVVREVAGNATLTFGDCNSGTFRYAAFGQAQALPVKRLSQTMGAGCTQVNGVPGEPVMPYAGQSGSWYDVSHSGEGFGLQWMSRNEAVVTWFTYDTSGNQVWLEGLGEERDGAIVFDHMLRTSGPHFGTAFDPASMHSEDWGTLTLRIDCNQGTAHYVSSQSEFGSGDLNLTRLTGLKKPGCPAVKPKLTDLYDITWDELPNVKATPQEPGYSAQSIADDGTVAGLHFSQLALWHPDTRAWEDVPREITPAPGAVISPDGSKVIATDLIYAQDSNPPNIHTLLWQRSTGWQPLPGLNMSIAYRTSHNFGYVVGTGRDTWDGIDSIWVQALDGIQRLIPVTDAVRLPSAVSNDGNTVIGVTLRFPTSFPKSVATRWDGDAAPTIMHDPAGEELAVPTICDANCNIVYGTGLYNCDPNHEHLGETWFLKSDGTFEYFGALADASAHLSANCDLYAPTDVTPDGSMAVGVYVIDAPRGYPAAGMQRAFIWTEATGIVSVRSLIDDLGIGDDDWDLIRIAAISTDGRQILLAGLHRLDLFPIANPRSVVLHLTPKVVPD
ncbi:MAG: hypothetical protein QM741_17865 [Rudaea sp.]|uniref:hypothetical protein n=1 Tax=Rudaea sp. TaxID=2136325 RepID=UPI0039E2C9D7